MKKPISILLLGLVGLVTTSALVISPHEFLENLRQLWQDRQQSQHEERLYLHTDKSLYEPGEVIWINAMLLNRADHTPTTLSDVVHLKLFDPRGQQIDSTAVVVHDGTAKADFQLSSQRPGGLYELRGYTRWMLNEGEDAYFSKRLTVLKTETPRLLMKLDFEREGYGERDTVVAQLKVRSLAGEAAAGATVYANWILRGSMVQKDTLFLDANGEVNLSLLLSDMEQNTVGLLNAVVDFQGTQESISRRIPIPSGSVSIAFFPEGGRYVAGVPARLGFKAVDTYQKGVEVSGEIRTAEGQTVASFESYHQGMGAVAFTPTPNQRYYAHIQKPFPQPRQALPEADMEGWVLRYDTTKVGAAHFVVHSQAADTAHVVAHSLGVLRYSQALPLQAGVTRFNIPLDSFPRGTAVFTLWDADTRLPMCERLVFLDHQKELRVHLETDKPHYQPREEIQVKVRTTDSEGNPVSARLSMAAVDEQVLSFADDKQDNLLTYMLLSSEVKGKIEEPSFYLNPEEPKATMARDYLLMTQGWRGFSYESLWSPIPVVTYPAEQETTINGRLLLSDFRRGAQGTVYLIEQGGKNRMLPVRTTPAGYFSFRNLDPTILNILAVRKPLIPGMLNDGQVTVQAPTESRRSGGRFTPIWESTIPNPEGVAVATNEATPGPSLPEDEFADAMTLEPDVQNLDEVVVVALSTGAQRQDLTGSISLISNEYSHLGSQGASNLLAGSAAGIQIRGTSSFSHTASIYGSRAVGMDGPLLIIDGLPVAPENRDQMLSLLGTEGQKIEAISVLQGLQATQIYGSRATGGVIVISTSDRNPKQPLFDLAPRYNTLLLYPKYYRVMREFYPVTALKEDADGLNRLAQDRRTTLYWDPSVTTNEQGEATLTFRAGDKESSFALSAEGFTSQGDLGKGETTFGVGLPLSIDVKLPAFLSVNDTLRASVQLRNRTQDTLTTQFSVGAPPEVYQVSGVPTGPLVIPPQQSIAVPVQVYVPTYQAPHSRRVESQRRFSRGVRYEYIRRELAFRVASEKYQDSLRLPLPLRQTGFPRYVSQTSSEPHHIYAFDLVTPEVSTIRATFRANSDVLSQMLGTLEATRSRPFGCFEQSTSRTLMNSIALQWLTAEDELTRSQRAQTRLYLLEGVEKLKQYRTKDGGYGWFGGRKSYPTLVGYALLAMKEMSRATTLVSGSGADEARQWLETHVQENGTWLGPKYRYNQPGYLAEISPVKHAYLVYALAETGSTRLEQPYQRALTQLDSSWSSYRGALLANAAFSLGDTLTYQRLIQELKLRPLERSRDLYYLQEQSAMGGWGNSYYVETKALHCLALLKNRDDPTALAQARDRIVDLSQARQLNYYYSSHASVLAMQALSEYFGQEEYSRTGGEFRLAVNDSLLVQVAYEEGKNSRPKVESMAPLLTQGKNTVQVDFDGMEGNLIQHQLDVTYHSLTPESNDYSPIALETNWSHSQVSLNQIATLTVKIINTQSRTSGMVVAEVGLPSGVQLAPWRLKELVDEAQADFVEVFDGRLVLYYVALGAGEERVVTNETTAIIPGSFRAPASKAYPYYAEELVTWIEGHKLTVRE